MWCSRQSGYCKNLCMFVCSVSLFPDMSCLLLSKHDWDVVLAAVVLLPWLLFWVRMLYDPSNPLQPLPHPALCLFILCPFFALLSPMFSFGMTQLDVFKLKWKKGCGVSPLQARGSYHWSKDHRGWVSFTQTVPRLPRLIRPLAASVAEAGPGCPSMSSVCLRSE